MAQAAWCLGGLLQDEYAGNQDKIPGLGDLPFFGNLFKSEVRNRKKTNLMVFLRPVIVRDAQAGNTLSMDRYDMMRGLQDQSIPSSSRNLPINDVPQMPSAAPGADPAAQNGRPLISAPVLHSAPALAKPPAPR